MPERTGTIPSNNPNEDSNSSTETLYHTFDHSGSENGSWFSYMFRE